MAVIEKSECGTFPTHTFILTTVSPFVKRKLLSSKQLECFPSAQIDSFRSEQMTTFRSPDSDA
jgi:hypothetical protein